MQPIDLHLAIDDGGTIVCVRCGHRFCGAGENFKEHAIRHDRPVQDANPLIVDPRLFVDDELVFRQYVCPGCATLLENEVVLASTAPVWDKQVGG